LPELSTKAHLSDAITQVNGVQFSQLIGKRTHSALGEPNQEMTNISLKTHFYATRQKQHSSA